MNFQRERFSRRQTGGRRLQPDAVRATGPRVPRPAHAEPQSRSLQSEPELCARSSHGNAWPARAAAAPLLMGRAAMRARVTRPAPVDAKSRREQMRSQRRSPADEAVRGAPLRSPQIGRQGSTWARFWKEAESHQSFFRLSSLFGQSQCRFGFCHSHIRGRV